MGGGVLSVLGSHIIDLLTYLDLGRYIFSSSSFCTFGSHIIDLLTYLDLGRSTSTLSTTACTLKLKAFIIHSRVMRVNATLKTVTTTTDNIGGIRQEL